MKEYELLSKYHFPDAPIEGPFDAISMALYNKQTKLLQLDACRAQVNEVFDYLELRRRYDDLFYKADSKLQYTVSDFVLDGHKFQTLDEVEKAIKNKAFL